MHKMTIFDSTRPDHTKNGSFEFKMQISFKNMKSHLKLLKLLHKWCHGFRGVEDCLTTEKKPYT